MKNILKTILIILGCSLVINAIVLEFITNFNFGVIITLAIGLILTLYGIYFNYLNKLTKVGFLKWLKYILFVFFIFLICLIAYIAIFGQFDNATYNEDAVIVLGAGIKGEMVTMPLAYRLDKAVEYSNNNPNAIIIVSGGKGFQENVTEAYAMELYLIKKGISKDKIIKEEKATSTYENIVFSKEILDKYFKRHYKTVIITNNFHIYRVTQISKKENLNTTHLYAKLDWYTTPINYLREAFGIMKFWIFKM
jgi:uncharacterized SAM-binding protein YcdF (DUF218 family)